MNEVDLAALLAAFLAASGLYLLFCTSKRTAQDVVEDISNELKNFEISKDGQSVIGQELQSERTKKLIKAGLLTAQERKRFISSTRLYPIMGGLAGVAVKLTLGGPAPFLIAAVVVGVSLGFILKERRIRVLSRQYQQTLEFHLPIVMERLVMAVQSGLDITAALRTIIELETGNSKSEVDPLTKLLISVQQLNEEGLIFEQALREVGNKVDCSAVRHAFIHLAVAHQEGGELVMPLKELGDSTQLYYQESVDEQIAKLPVKATLPLLCTFSGLIICFITSPLISLTHLAGNTAKNLQ